MTANRAKNKLLTRRQALKQFSAGAGFTILGSCGPLPKSAETTAAEFNYGVASGDPTQSAVVIWTRAVPTTVSEIANVSFEIAHDETFNDVVRRGMVQTSSQRDFTIKVDVTDLKPATTYFYRFASSDNTSAIGRTRTLPRRSANEIKFALASCANYPSGFFNAYREISKFSDLDAIIHVGDYIYEYAADGYDSKTGIALGRIHEPAHEIITLADYRERFAQYRADPDLQAAHATAPFITIWDDHETANNSWMDGSSNHHEEAEGSWQDRRDAALQAYFEWMPMRDPVVGVAAERLNRTYDFGDIASLHVIETRLTGRDEPLSYSRDLPMNNGTPDVEKFRSEILNDPSRTMMGTAQEAWLKGELSSSKDRGIAWQILGNQTVMARMNTPDFTELMPKNMLDASMAKGGYTAMWLERSKLGLPVSLDSWDGYPAARERLFDTVKSTDANLVVLSGDSHMFWANNLHSAKDEKQVAIEIGTGSITSPGGYESLSDDPAIFDIAKKGVVAHNADVAYANVHDHGFVVITATKSDITADYFKVSTTKSKEYEASRFLSVLSKLTDQGPSPFKAIS
ncbi:alkaline phosphatase D family protein [Hyphococcus sp. DH-69]|uniref:alkaline phosphatase D family protein n=1 Tax=Hyphococcus formosus TaxID=3143534 RepID=UPI00398B6FC4